MNLFYVNASQIEENHITIIGTDVNHIKNVLRMKHEEELMVCDCEDTNYLCKINEFQEKEIILDIIEKKPCETELKTKIYLFQGLPKSDKMELIIQKAVELGVYEVIPVAMKRSIVKIEDKKKEKKKLERWQAIAESAAKQSKRGVIPSVHTVMSYKEALAYARDFDLKLFPYENADGMNKSRELVKNASDTKSIGIFIGPEGGFDDAEIEAVKEIGGEVITLGKRILRTETAGFTILSILMFELDSI
ncbi:MAG: 16S rRNA (uracil(1498)-N(3))-methyltransferase [bacterium]|nr:16S rRNA (uracil(1498)-N(3))-methyltransferase [bacterium]